MVQVNFYHISASPVEKVLPKLLEKVWGSGKKALVMAPTEERVEAINTLLWVYSTKVFLPHGSQKDGYEKEQPVFLSSTGNNPNEAIVLVVVEDAMPSQWDAFERCLYLFSEDNPGAVEKARQRWKQFKQQGCELVYWQQAAKGSWEKKEIAA